MLLSLQKPPGRDGAPSQGRRDPAATTDQAPGAGHRRGGCVAVFLLACSKRRGRTFMARKAHRHGRSTAVRAPGAAGFREIQNWSELNAPADLWQGNVLADQDELGYWRRR